MQGSDTLYFYHVGLYDPMNEIIQGNRWVIYVLVYCVLFLINATVLALIH